IRHVYDEDPKAEVQFTTECNIFATGQQYIEQPEIITEEFAFAKPTHMIASSSSRNSSKNMPRFSSNDMVYNHYLDEARKKTQERDRNSKTSVMPSARFQSTDDDSKPKPRSTNHLTRSLPIPNTLFVQHVKSVFNANHDACITKLLKEVNSQATVKSYKTRNSNKPIEQKSHTQKPSRQIFTGYRFSSNKSSDVYEKTSPRSCLWWKPTGRIFDIVGLRWIPTRKLLDSCTGNVDSEPQHGFNVDISKIHKCKQTLDLSAGTSINVQKKQSINLSAELESVFGPLYSTNISIENTANMIVMMSMIELESIFGPLFDGYLNGENQVVLNSSAVTTVDASDKRQQLPNSTSSTSTLATTVTANGNFDL
ncbi:hypothetical protein Tco_1177818, partial [Tanacetum coccineum]